MKRILVVSIGTEIGGIETALISFLKYLSNRSCQVDLLLWKRPGPLFSKIPSSVRVLPSPGPGTLREVLKSPLRQRCSRIAQYCRYRLWKKRGMAWKVLPELEGEYDIAISYCQDGHSPYYVADKVRSGRKLLFFHHGSYDKSGKELALDKTVYPRYERIVCVSQSNRNVLLTIFPELKDKLTVVPNLIDYNRICRLADEEVRCFSREDALKITTVGRLSKEKGPDLALKAAAVLRDKVEFEWVFVGDGSMKDELLETARALGLTQCCRFVGARENPYPYMRQADLYVQPSQTEADPLALKEALVLHSTVIASDCPAIRDCLDGGRLGVLCEMTGEAFAQAIITWDSSRPAGRKTGISEADIAALNANSIQKLDQLLDLREEIQCRDSSCTGLDEG